MNGELNFIKQRCDRRFFRVSKRHGLGRRAMINVGIYTFQIPMVLQQVLIVGQAGSRRATPLPISREILSRTLSCGQRFCAPFFSRVVIPTTQPRHLCNSFTGTFPHISFFSFLRAAKESGRLLFERESHSSAGLEIKYTSEESA